MKRLTKTILALCALSAFAFAQEKPKAAVYIMGTPDGRDLLRMSVNNFLIKSGKYEMIAVDAIEVLAKEVERQTGGSVSDEQIAGIGRDAGAQYVCVVERTEYDGYTYITTRMVSVESKIATLAEMSELARGERLAHAVERQINNMLGVTADKDKPQTPATNPTVTGRRSRVSILNVIMQNTQSMSNTHSEYLRVKPNLYGKVTVKFSIDEFGKVVSSRVTESTVNDREFERVVADNVKTWFFERIDRKGDVTEVEYPFVFSREH